MMVYAYMLENTSEYQYVDNSILIKFLNENKVEEDSIYIDDIDDIKRIELGKLIGIMKAKDTLIVRSISDLSNNNKVEDIAKALKYLNEKKIDLISILESYYTYKTYYQAFIDFSSISHLLNERKRLIGIQKSKREKKMGRKKNTDKINMALMLYDKKLLVKDVLKLSGISSSTLYREIKKRNEDIKR